MKCHSCQTPVVWEREDESQPHEAEVCQHCGEKFCPDCMEWFWPLDGNYCLVCAMYQVPDWDGFEAGVHMYAVKRGGGWPWMVGVPVGHALVGDLDAVIGFQRMTSYEWLLKRGGLRGWVNEIRAMSDKSWDIVHFDFDNWCWSDTKL